MARVGGDAEHGAVAEARDEGGIAPDAQHLQTAADERQQRRELLGLGGVDVALLAVGLLED